MTCATIIYYNESTKNSIWYYHSEGEDKITKETGMDMDTKMIGLDLPINLDMEYEKNINEKNGYKMIINKKLNLREPVEGIDYDIECPRCKGCFYNEEYAAGCSVCGDSCPSCGHVDMQEYDPETYKQDFLDDGGREEDWEGDAYE